MAAELDPLARNFREEVPPVILADGRAVLLERTEQSLEDPVAPPLGFRKIGHRVGAVRRSSAVFAGIGLALPMILDPRGDHSMRANEPLGNADLAERAGELIDGLPEAAVHLGRCWRDRHLERSAGFRRRQGQDLHLVPGRLLVPPAGGRAWDIEPPADLLETGVADPELGGEPGHRRLPHAFVKVVAAEANRLLRAIVGHGAVSSHVGPRA